MKKLLCNLLEIADNMQGMEEKQQSAKKAASHQTESAGKA